MAFIFVGTFASYSQNQQTNIRYDELYISRFFFDFEIVECETHKNERDRDREEQRELLFGIITIFR